MNAPDPLAALTAAEVPCPLCGGPLRARLDKRQRIYLSCELCRMRVFAPLNVDRAADLLAGFALLSTPEGTRAAGSMRGRLGLPTATAAPRATTSPAAPPLPATGTDR